MCVCVCVCVVGVSVVAVSFFIMFFDVELPNELKGFLFYAQVRTYMYNLYIYGIV